MRRSLSISIMVLELCSIGACSPIKTVIKNDVGEQINVKVWAKNDRLVAYGAIPSGSKLILEEPIGSIDKIEYQYGKRTCTLRSSEFYIVLGKDRKADSLQIAPC